jgi:hypothetical protein
MVPLTMVDILTIFTGLADVQKVLKPILAIGLGNLVIFFINEVSIQPAFETMTW